MSSFVHLLWRRLKNWNWGTTRREDDRMHDFARLNRLGGVQVAHQVQIRIAANTHMGVEQKVLYMG